MALGRSRHRPCGGAHAVCVRPPRGGAAGRSPSQTGGPRAVWRRERRSGHAGAAHGDCRAAPSVRCLSDALLGLGLEYLPVNDARENGDIAMSIRRALDEQTDQVFALTERISYLMLVEDELRGFLTESQQLLLARD